MYKINKINHHLSFTKGPTIHIWAEDLPWYLYEIYEHFAGDWSLVQYHVMSPYTWYNYHAKQNRKNYRIKVSGFINDEFVTLIDHIYDETDENVLLKFKTDSYNETKIWTEQSIQYKKLTLCNVTIESKFYERLREDYKYSGLNFEGSVPTDFLNPGEFYASFTIGKIHYTPESLGEWGSNHMVYSNHTKPQVSHNHKIPWLGLSSEEIFNDIMNL